MKNNNQFAIAFILLLLSNLSVLAQERSTEDLNNLALNFMAKQANKTNIEILESSNTYLSSRTMIQKNYKIINLKPQGWVIVSSDDIARPILGYSVVGHLDANNLEENQKNWLLGLDQEIEAGKEAGLDNDSFASDWNTLVENPEAFKTELEYKKSLSPALSTIQDPLLGSIQWGQGYPYNNYTPKLDATHHALVGCTATAIAQIMVYFKWPTRGTGSYSYEHKVFGTLSANFDKKYNWTNMSADDKATISYDIGIMCNMDYDTDGSGGWPNISGWKTYYKYSLSRADEKNNFTNSAWDKKIKDSIDGKSPIWYAGFDTDGNGGHSFVLDGYDDSNDSILYHFNWGWSGYGNGWYAIGAMNAGGYKLNKKHYAIFNIKPVRPLTIPESPISVNATNIERTTATLSWTDNAGDEEGFKIYRGTTLVKTVGANVQTAALTGLTPNTTYTYSVKAYNSAGESANDSSTTFTTQADVQVSKSIITSPVSGIKVNANETITLEWENHGATRKILYAASKRNAGYQIIKNISSLKGTSLTFKLPTGFTRAYAYILSYNGTEYLGYSIVYLYPQETITKPSSPTNINATNIERTTATLSWTDNAGDEEGFKIYRGTTLVKTVGANVQTAALTGLTPNTTYTYSVKAYNSAGESANDSSTTFTTQADVQVSKSIITSPVSGIKINANETITLEWENHGATRKSLYIAAKVNTTYPTIKNISSLTGTSLTFKLPTGFTRAYAYILSYNGTEYLGYSRVYFYPKTK